MIGAQNRIRVCIVEDHQLVREGLAALIASQPDMSVVSQCSSVSETLAALASGSVDLILLDLLLGVDTGFNLLEQLPRTSFTGRVLVVAGAVTDQDAFRLASMGAAGIALKTVSTDLLLKAIRKVFEGEVWFDQYYLKRILEGTARVAAGGHVEDISSREKTVMRHLLNGLANKEIASRMGLPETSVKSTIQILFQKTGVRTRAQLVRVAMERSHDWQ